MIIIPAIDLRAGRCVRLVQGDFARERVYGDDPVDVARHWAECGAPLLHVVDLDGAIAGRPMQLDLIRAMIACVDCPVQVGGGLRTMADLEAAFAVGVARAILGTAALDQPALLQAALERWGPERILVSVDARNGSVVVRGWLEERAVTALEFVSQLREFGVRHVIYTDTARDGMLSGPDVDGIMALAHTGVQVIASGGIATRQDLERLATIPGVEGAIVGRAIYDGTIVLQSPTDWVIEPQRGTEQEEAEAL
ncbi:1-(5-phosphoribosyl)-5-[(5-phosphoribosylamino)methylideneamino]imidazole-4-carboxamide isomerase [Thermorudis peleae]|uniref:1-(5-phosphoribosyl)-5-[(5- phosphoribosylamino)methylideneamino]imidazole-4- carboxamide isomerase n=1 Tax=Thermorudis peleae TaxID=1382356 RepID=UPI00068F1A2D|nr:1-(5-phosphoribosyl)-5-[(5-phosphoribosylamino)methylideneamino]imidazole-4-carboxamide isomerase [Thermorudis peleae]MBX6753511.1 1-(5-phosphoribosyl)-5-[(5-phosphoribosylamino)methylideneamino]imidazole-4-carboxamide isomerase [Thermorudis peleae]